MTHCKNHSLLAALSLATLLACSGCANPNQKEVYVPLNTLPVAAQKAVVSEADGQEIEKIEKKLQDGKVIYDVKTSGKRCLKIADDGTVLSHGHKTVDIPWKKVPSAVRKTIMKNADGHTFDTVEKETMRGKTVYEAKIMNEDGSKTIIKVAPGGKLISSKTNH